MGASPLVTFAQEVTLAKLLMFILRRIATHIETL